MRKIINGKLYDTDTATYIGSREHGTPRDFEYVSETLYQKKSGELFLYGEGGAMSRYSESCGSNSWKGSSTIIPERDFDVKKWVSKHCDVETYIKLFGPVTE